MEPKLSENALKVLERRYLKKDEEGRVIETPEEMFLRVASANNILKMTRHIIGRVIAIVILESCQLAVGIGKANMVIAMLGNVRQVQVFGISHFGQCFVLV